MYVHLPVGKCSASAIVNHGRMGRFKIAFSVQLHIRGMIRRKIHLFQVEAKFRHLKDIGRI